MTQDDLKPCPFCNGDAELKKFTNPFNGDHFSYVGCEKGKCWVQGPKIHWHGLTKNEADNFAIQSWNTRALGSAAQEAELVEALKKILWLRPLGDCKNKTILEMEKIAREALTEYTDAQEDKLK